MFLGTTPAIISQFIQREIEILKPKRLFVPFAGNFVIEQLAGVVDKNIEVFSTDVSLYSRAVGYGLAGMESEITLKDEILNEFTIYKNHTEPIDKAVAAIFFAEAATARRKKSILYYKRLLQDAIDNQEAYYKKIKDRLLKVQGLLGNFKFYGIDAMELLKDVRTGDFVFYDPPYFVDGYKKMFADLDECFNHTPPKFTDITEVIQEQQLTEFCNNGVNAMFRDYDRDEPVGYEIVYKYEYKDNTFFKLFVNYNSDSRFVGRRDGMKEKAPNYPIITYEDVITEESKIEVVSVKAEVANHYRLLWVKKATMTGGGCNFLVLIDGKVSGVLTLTEGTKLGTDLISIFSDPAATTSRYERLGKLILYICCSREVISRMNDTYLWEHTGFTTRVFTNNPVSMKYRGLFTLKERKKATTGNYENALIYQNRENIFSSLEEALKVWLKKEGKKVRNPTLQTIKREVEK
jgi:hypothetical protein